MSAARTPSPKAHGAASSAALLNTARGAEPLRITPIADVVGEAGSKAALAKLSQAITEMKAAAAAPLLERAVEALRREDAVEAGKLAAQALESNELSGFGWYLLAIARERLGDFKSSIQCYEAALSLLPAQAEIANDIGRLAYRLEMRDVAVKLFQHYIDARPDMPDGPNNLACTLRDLGRYDEAIDALKRAIAQHPENPLLWNTLGTVVSDQGDLETSVLFFTEAVRLQPTFSKARYNRGNVLTSLGRYEEALEDCKAAMASPTASPDERAMMRLSLFTIMLCLGRVGEGWDEYEARLLPELSGVTHFIIDRPKWTPEADIRGKHLLLMGEQGLGDEVLFANVLPDILEELGPEGRLSVTVEPRLVNLFQRSFPNADIMAHSTYKVDAHMVRGAPGLDQETVDMWAPIASPLRRFRRTVEAFPDRPNFLVADPARIAHWREVLNTAPLGLKVGLLWKSMKLQGSRANQFSPFHQWAPVLQTAGVSFINMQYGDCDEELALARDELGVNIWTPPGIDLKQDLDEVAALSCALDLTIGFANATTNIAAACGAPIWMLAVPGAWTQAGSGRYPWYPQARAFNPPEYQAWTPTMEAVAAALAEKVAAA